MAIMNVNPTRMELKRLQARLKTASRGYKLLKDKTDEMIRKFIILARENKSLRKQVEEQLAAALQSFALARTFSDSRTIDEAVMMPSRAVSLQCGKHSVMGISVPSIEIAESKGEIYPYGFLTVPEQLDNSVNRLNDVFAQMVHLAEVEKTCNMLADEIEKNKRRVNALENIMIPQLQETIKYIKMKLDENERSSTVRLMKVKDMLAQK